MIDQIVIFWHLAPKKIHQKFAHRVRCVLMGDQMDVVELSLRSEALLNSPLYNKGTAFTQEERDAFGLHGLLPSHVSTLEEQVARRYKNFLQKPDQLSKYVFLTSLQNRNETLFYRLVFEHLEETLPLIYTPTVGDASLHFSLIYRQHRGAYFSYPLKDRMEEMVRNLPYADLDVIVVTDGERILGLGDVGIGGMAIPMGKLALYTLFGGLHPSTALPVMLDVGTNNEELLRDPLYLGWRHERIVGQEYDDFVDLFVQAIKKRYPRVLVQWEDFAKPHALPLLMRYREQICSFNDDIQGTASVVLAGLFSAIKLQKSTLKEQRIAVFGGGSAGMGICKLILHALMKEGMTEQEARLHFYIIDIDGLIHTDLVHLDEEQRKFATPTQEIASWMVKDRQRISLLEVIHHVHPSILIGVSAQPGAFNEEVVMAMSAYVERPIIFPLSNPTTKSEARPQDLIQWTKGKALIATGSPFAPVQYFAKTHTISQCNNVYSFPGIGLGVVTAKIPKVTESMFIRAAHILSDHSPLLNEIQGPIFPGFENLRAISRAIAIGVIQQAEQEGLCSPTSLSAIEKRVDQKMWTPHYACYTQKAASKALS